MTSGSGTLPVAAVPGHAEPRAPRRREKREALVRQVEINPFPRVLPGEQPRMGTTRDLSASGLCVRTDVEQPVGALLRVILHGVDGRPALESVGRVAWCQGGRGGTCWLGLSLVAKRRAAPGPPLHTAPTG